MKVNKAATLLAGSLVTLGLCASLVSAKTLIQSAPFPATGNSRPHMDLAFCIDTTGSMQKEIDMVKTKTKEMVAKLSSGKPTPIVRVGLVAYRDIGDSYVTKVFPFSDDIDKVVKDIASLKAEGGGDAPEAVDQGLHAALTELNWDDSNRTAKLLFLIGDAGPHGGGNDLDWRQDCRNAIRHGIQINTMGCQGLSNTPLAVFKEIASLTDGKYQSLAYRQEVVDSRGERSTIVSSGSSVYKVPTRYGADWKTAMSRGMLEKVSDSPTASLMPEGMGGGSVAAAAMAPLPSGASSVGAHIFVAPQHYDARAKASYVSSSRADNNLDELMLDAAKDKAAKTLKIGY